MGGTFYPFVGNFKLYIRLLTMDVFPYDEINGFHSPKADPL